MSKFDTLADKEQHSILRFIDHLWMENGLSDNTLSAYRVDLANFAFWLSSRELTLLDVKTVDIQSFLAYRYDKGQKRRSNARLLSTLKRYYAYLLREKQIAENPTHLLEAPKSEHHLPNTLNEEQVLDLLNAPDVSTDLGLRDRAMIELLYATGLRVTELISLQLSQISIDPGVIRVIGKGDKERLVPVGEVALDYLSVYLSRSRSSLLNKQSVKTNAVFVT